MTDGKTSADRRPSTSLRTSRQSAAKAKEEGKWKKEDKNHDLHLMDLW
jgi:hypothetical protein